MNWIIAPSLVEPPPGALSPAIAQFVGWFGPLSEPVRLKKGLRAPYHPSFTMDTDFTPRATTFLSWYAPYSDPVRLPIGLKAPHQADFFAPPRALPTPDVTVILDATETNNDVALIGINIAGGVSPASREGASVSIVEIPAQSDAGLSISED